MSQEFRLQDPGEGIKEAEIIDLFIEPGKTVREDDILLDVETDKAVVEVPSPFSGTIDEVRVRQGDVAAVGDVLFTYTPDQKSAAPEKMEQGEKHEQRAQAATSKKEKDVPEKEQEVTPPAEKETTVTSPTASSRKLTPVPAAPATRRLARELGVSLEDVKPSGPHGRVKDQDVRDFAEHTVSEGEERGHAEKGFSEEEPEAGKSEFSRWGEVKRVPLRGLRRKVAEHMTEAWKKIPHVTHQQRVDITELEALRQRHKAEVAEAGGHLTLTVFAIKAVIAALKRYPRFNASLDEAESQLVLKQYYHIGVAVDTDKGLLVPVVRNADRKDLIELAVELKTLVERTRAGELKLEDMRGGSFSLTNPGMLGGHAFTPLINYPEAAILGLAEARLEPVVEGTLDDYTISPRLILPLCLAFDHRINDGADAAKFMNAIAEALSDPEKMLLKS